MAALVLALAGAGSSSLSAQDTPSQFARLDAWLNGGDGPRAVQVVPLRRDERIPEARLFTGGSIGAIVPADLAPEHRLPLGKATSWLRRVTTDTVLAQRSWSIDDTLGECLPEQVGELPPAFADLRWRELRDGQLCLARPYSFQLREDEEPRSLTEVLRSNIHLRAEDPWNFGPGLSEQGASAVLQWALEAATGTDWGALVREQMAERLRLPSLRGLHQRFEADNEERLLAIDDHDFAYEVAAYADASLTLGDLESFLRQWIRTETSESTYRWQVLEIDVLDTNFGHLRIAQIPEAGLAAVIVDPEGETIDALRALLIDLELAEPPQPSGDGWNSAVGLGGGAGGRRFSGQPEDAEELRDRLRLPGRYEADFEMLDGDHRVELTLPADPEEDIVISVDGQGRPPSRLKLPEMIGGIVTLRTRPKVWFHEWRGELRGFAQEQRNDPERDLSWAVRFRRTESIASENGTRWLGGTELAKRTGVEQREEFGVPTGPARLVAISQMDDMWFGTGGQLGVDSGEAFDHTMPFPLGSLSRVIGFLADETLGHRHPSRLFWQRASDGITWAESLERLPVPHTSVGPHGYLGQNYESFAPLVSRIPLGEAPRDSLTLLRDHLAPASGSPAAGHSDLKLVLKQALYESGNVYQSLDAFLNEDLAPRYGLGAILHGFSAASAVDDFAFRTPDGRLVPASSSDVPLARGLVTDAASLVRATRSLYDGSLPSWTPSRPADFGFRLVGPNSTTRASFFYLRDDDPHSTRRVLFCHELDLVMVLFAAENAEDWADDIEQSVLSYLVPGQDLPRHVPPATDALLSASAPVRPVGPYEGVAKVGGKSLPIRLQVSPGSTEIDVEFGDEITSLQVTGAGLTRIRLEGVHSSLGPLALEIERLRFSERLRASLSLVNLVGGRWPIPVEMRRPTDDSNDG